MIVDIKTAIEFLKDNEVVAIPTETVYGLAALANSSKAVSKIYALKNRPTFNPLIVHISHIDQLEKFAQTNANVLECCHFFWQQRKPLTVVLPLQDGHSISSLVTAGLNTIAVRMPHHDIALQIIQETGPLAAPSANISNSISPTSSKLVMDSFKEKTPPVVEGGTCKVGVESTIIDLSADTPILLRPGGVTKEELDDFFKCPIQSSHFGTINAPGQLKVHYSPGCPVFLNQLTCHDNEVLLGFGPDAPDCCTLNLSPSGNLVEAASNLFEHLSILASQKPKAIMIMPIPNIEMGLAINDRLSRAANYLTN